MPSSLTGRADHILVAMEALDSPAALTIHVDVLTRGSQTDDIGLRMSGIKQLIIRLQVLDLRCGFFPLK